MAARFSAGYRPPGTLCHPSRNARPGDEHECAAGAARALRPLPWPVTPAHPRPASAPSRPRRGIRSDDRSRPRDRPMAEPAASADQSGKNHYKSHMIAPRLAHDPFIKRSVMAGLRDVSEIPRMVSVIAPPRSWPSGPGSCHPGRGSALGAAAGRTGGGAAADRPMWPGRAIQPTSELSVRIARSRHDTCIGVTHARAIRVYQNDASYPSYLRIADHLRCTLLCFLLSVA